jgi:hypothetical protein
MDRFSRQNPRIAMTLLLRLINAGIRVVTLFDERVYSDTSQTIDHDLIGAILYMSEAHKASARKADLIQQSWDGKRKGVASGERRMLTRVCPAWLSWNDKRKKFVANPGAKTVRRIYEWAAVGLSSNAIYKRLNATNVPALTGNKISRQTGQSVSNGWNSARVLEIIKSDSPLGWFQPHRRDGKVRVPVGESIKDYYPRVVSQELADRARYQMAQRAFGGKGSGRNGAVTNLFSGLSYCGVCGSPMYLYHHGIIRQPGRSPRFHAGYLRCSSKVRRTGCDNDGSVPYAVMERSLIEYIGGWSVDQHEVADDGTKELVERLAETRAEAEKIEQAVRHLLDEFLDRPSPLVKARIAELEAQHAKLLQTTAALEKQVATERSKPQASEEISVVQRIIRGIESLDGDKRIMARTRIAAGMRRFIFYIVCRRDRGLTIEYAITTDVTCTIRLRLTDDAEYEIYHTDWSYPPNPRAGKPLPVEYWLERSSQERSRSLQAVSLA